MTETLQSPVYCIDVFVIALYIYFTSARLYYRIILIVFMYNVDGKPNELTNYIQQTRHVSLYWLDYVDGGPLSGTPMLGQH